MVPSYDGCLRRVKIVRVGSDLSHEVAKMLPNMAETWNRNDSDVGQGLRAYARWEYGDPNVAWILATARTPPRSRMRVGPRLKLWLQTALTSLF